MALPALCVLSISGETNFFHENWTGTINLTGPVCELDPTICTNESHGSHGAFFVRDPIYRRLINKARSMGTVHNVGQYVNCSQLPRSNFGFRSYLLKC